MIRIAVLSDIHGNLPALEAVLTETDRSGADLIVLNGDLADGPFPAETLDRLAALGDRAVWVRGNGDRWLAEARAGRFRHQDRETQDMIEWAASHLTGTHCDRLAALPLLRTLTHPVLGRIGVCHATARGDNEVILVDSPLAHYAAAFSQLDAPLIVTGHTHMPFDRLAGGRRFVNAGSVGMPYGHSGASWLFAHHDIMLRRAAYDTESAARRIAASGMPGTEAFLRTYVRATPSDAEALTALRLVAERQHQSGDFG